MNPGNRGGLKAFRELAGTQRVLTTAISKPTAGKRRKTGMKDDFTGQVTINRKKPGVARFYQESGLKPGDDLFHDGIG